MSTLIGVHLSDNGIRRNYDDPDNDLMLKVLDHFGINDCYWKENSFRFNKWTKDPEKLRKIVH